MSNRLATALLVAGILLAGCSGSGSDGIGPTDPTSGNGNPGTGSSVGAFHANFVPLSGVLPYPTDLYFSGSTDGTLNSPVTPFLPNAAAINALDGYSTNASATARFSAPIDPATVSAATVFMIEVDVDNATKATVGFRRLLVLRHRFHRARRPDARLGRRHARDRPAEAAHAVDRRDERRLPHRPHERPARHGRQRRDARPRLPHDPAARCRPAPASPAR